MPVSLFVTVTFFVKIGLFLIIKTHIVGSFFSPGDVTVIKVFLIG